MQYIEVSVSSHETQPCYSLATTDFSAHNIPEPPKGFKGGSQDDVLIYFENAREMEDYIEQLDALCNHKNPLECNTVKLKKIIDTIGLQLPLERMKEVFKENKFVEIQSGLPYRFVGTTLNVSNTPHSQYKITENQGEFFLVSGLDSEPLKIFIDSNTGIIIFRRNNGKVVINLRPE